MAAPSADLAPQMVRQIPAADYVAATGKPGGAGRELDHERDRPGYAFLRPGSPLLLEPGLYRATFTLRRGHYPSSGFLRPTFTVFHLEIFDATADAVIIDRDLQVSDFDGANDYARRWLEFSMDGRKGHVVEPRVFWPGLVNGEVESVTIERLPVETAERLDERARSLAERLRSDHLENGYVVSRRENDEADETGDAVTYTGFYASALAWKIAATEDALAASELENAMNALHNAVKGTPEEPIITRFVDRDGTPAAKSPSKDVYAAFFLACAAAYPRVRNEAIRAQIRSDVDRVATRLLQDDLTVRGGSGMLASLAPYIHPDDIRFGIHTLVSDRERARKTLKTLKAARRYVPFQEPLPGLSDIIKAIERRDEERLYQLVVPTMNGMVVLAQRVIDLLKENYRNDLVRIGAPPPERPGRRLTKLLGEALQKLPPPRAGKRFENVTDLRVVASNALIALHIVKTAAVITGKPAFEEYYRQNLYAQDALLKTALDWYGMEDELLRLTAGNADAARDRRGYLAMLATYNLFVLEENKSVKEAYRSLLAREAALSRHDDNPLAAALALSAGVKAEPVPLWRGLSLYPDDPSGLGSAYWKAKGREVAEAVGGGESEGFSREPLPVSYRPRDSFLWQRNPRRLKGDETKRYPGTDYLFLYWLARNNGLIPAGAPFPSVRAQPER